jgi:hypothetical protein
MNSAKNPLQFLLLIVLIFFLFSGCEKPNSGSAPSGKKGSEDQAKSYQKNKQIMVRQHHEENLVKNVAVKRKPMYVFRRLPSNH